MYFFLFLLSICLEVELFVLVFYSHGYSSPWLGYPILALEKPRRDGQSDNKRVFHVKIPPWWRKKKSFLRKTIAGGG